MNYFLNWTDLVPTDMDAPGLMRYLLHQATEQDMSHTFRKNFTDTIEHPNVLFVKKGTELSELTKNHKWREHKYPTGMAANERLAHAAAQNIVYIIASIGFYNDSRDVFSMEMYTLDSTGINAQMRRIAIDSIMKTI